MKRWMMGSMLVLMTAHGASIGLAEERQSASFTLDGKTYSLLLPKKAFIEPSVLPRQVTIRDLTKSQRLQRLLMISLEPNEAGSKIDQIRELPDGKTLAFQLADDIGGGSGGPIAELKGRVQIDGTQLFVECTDQNELSRDPEWCVPLLASLKRGDPQPQ
jgi:hypothetical protein